MNLHAFLTSKEAHKVTKQKQDDLPKVHREKNPFQLNFHDSYKIKEMELKKLNEFYRKMTRKEPAENDTIGEQLKQVMRRFRNERRQLAALE
jgi:hypothetical protein